MKSWLPIVLALVLLECAGLAQQSPAFTSKIEAVRVDVLVTDSGQPVRGLGPADFEVLDNGVAQQVERHALVCGVLYWQFKRSKWL